MRKPAKPKSSIKIKIRRRWRVNPQTKIKNNAKYYARRRERKILRKVLKNEAEENT